MANGSLRAVMQEAERRGTNPVTVSRTSSILLPKEGQVAESKGDRPLESGDVYETLRALKQAARLREPYEVTRFTGLRETQDGVLQEVDVEVLDAGPDADPHRRYQVRASAEGKQTIGNLARTPREAMAGMHWNKLDS